MTRRARGFAMIEALVAVLIIGIALLALLQVRNQTLLRFVESGDAHTGAWLAEMKMNELISQDLPDPEDEETWISNGSGDFGDYDTRANAINASVNEGWVERATFAKFEYEWTKELVLVGNEFIGSREQLEAWEAPLDENGDPEQVDDPRDKPLARVVRVTLKVKTPLRRGRDAEGGEESDEAYEKRREIKLVTYVDPAVVFNAAEEDTEETTESASNGGTNNGGTNNGGGGN